MKWSLSRSTTIALLLSPVGILLISVTRLLVISNYNAATASTIASSGGYINTLLGSFIPVVPLLMPYFALVLLFLDRVALAILALFATALTSPSALSKSDIVKTAYKDGHRYANTAHFRVLLVVFLVFLLALAIEVLGLDIHESIRTATLIAGLALLPFALLLYPPPIQSNFYAQQLRQPWLPAEIISLASGQNIVGYVLSKSDGWFIVLQESNRNIYYFPAGRVTKQEVCQLEPMNNERPIIDLFNAPTTTSSCSETSPVVPKIPVPVMPQKASRQAVVYR
jgi:hypothetical protein